MCLENTAFLVLLACCAHETEVREVGNENYVLKLFCVEWQVVQQHNICIKFNICGSVHHAFVVK